MTGSEQAFAREPQGPGTAMGPLALRVVSGPAAGPAPAPDVESLPLGALVVDGQGRSDSTNPAWRELTGLRARECRAHGWLQCLTAADRRSVLEDVRVAAEGGETVVADRRIRTRSGRTRWTRWWLRPALGSAGERMVVVVADVDDDHEAQVALQDRATHDPLTGLVNRAQFFELVEHAMLRRQRHPSPLAVLFVDLDRFKDLNDELGHRHGDQALVAVAGALQRVLRPSDALARIGGDEFAVLCDDLADPTDAHAVVQRIRDALERPLTIGDGTWSCSASVGVAFHERTDVSPEDLLDRADHAMYEQKRTGQGVRGVEGRARSAARPSCGKASSGPDRVADVVGLADEVVRTLLEIGLALAPDGEEDPRIRDARARLDELITGVRSRVLEELREDGVVH